jgi:thioredoxin 1
MMRVPEKMKPATAGFVYKYNTGGFQSPIAAPDAAPCWLAYNPRHYSLSVRIVMPDIFNVNLEDFEQQVLVASRQRIVLVDFWAAWCSPCLVIAPVLENVVSEYAGKVALAKLEVDEADNMKLAGRYRVRGFPTIILFKHGEEQARFSSARPKHFIQEFIEEWLD